MFVLDSAEFVAAAASNRDIVRDFKVSLKPISELETIFKRIDMDQDGKISPDECKQEALRGIEASRKECLVALHKKEARDPPTPEEISAFTKVDIAEVELLLDLAIKDMDTDGDGVISFPEFVVASSIGEWGDDTLLALSIRAIKQT